MTDAEIIVALGDTAVVAAAFGVKQNTVSNWKKRGISWKVRPLFKEFARAKRVKVPADFLKERRPLEERSAS